MAAANYDLTIEQGTDFSLTMNLSVEGVPYNLTGCSAAMQIRDFGNNLYFDGTVVNNKINLNLVASSITIKISKSETQTMNFGTGKYDLELTKSDGTTIRLLQGSVIISNEVTKD